VKTKLTEIKFKSAIGVAGQLFSRAAWVGTLILIYSSASAQIGPPVVTTNPATFVASFSATLKGSVNSHGLPTTFHFQYGTTTSYGLTTPPRTRTLNARGNVGANIISLAAHTTYHFRIVASNADGTRHGSDETFTTLTTTGPPVVITEPAVNPQCSRTCTPAKLNGKVDPHGLTTTVYFQWGPGDGWGCGCQYSTSSQSTTGNTYESVSTDVSVPGGSQVYGFRIVATNSAGASYGNVMTFYSPCCD